MTGPDAESMSAALARAERELATARTAYLVQAEELAAAKQARDTFDKASWTFMRQRDAARAELASARRELEALRAQKET